jgi:23S rRNA (adenine2503-C2)-methyltransferase
MNNLSRAARLALSDVAYIGRLGTVAKQVSAVDRTTKFLFQLDDGENIETVLLPHDYGLAVCVSSQVGCKMGCRFCASTRKGMVRNLTPGEMMEQVMSAAAVGAPGQRVSHITVMGMGEPLANLGNVLAFLSLAQSPEGLGISYRHITVSTCGLVPQIAELAAKELPITLAVSLHAAKDELRDELMPVNRKYPLSELIDACRRYAEVTGRRVTYEYALMRDVNDSVSDARALADLLRGSLSHVNLIPINPVEGTGYKRSSEERVETFRGILMRSGIETTVRREMGTDIDAACGQLRRRLEAEEKR